MSESNLGVLVTHPDLKAQAILDIVPGTQYKPPYAVQLMTDNGQHAYLELREGAGRMEISVLDENVFREKALANNIEGSILRSMVRQINVDSSLKQSFDPVYDRADDLSSDERNKRLIEDFIVSQRKSSESVVAAAGTKRPLDESRSSVDAVSSEEASAVKHHPSTTRRS